MELKVFKEIVKQEKTIVGYQCDACGVIFNATVNSHELPPNWHSFKVYDQDFQALATYHVCSGKCYAKMLQHSFDEYGNDHDVEISQFNIGFLASLLKNLKQ